MFGGGSDHGGLQVQEASFRLPAIALALVMFVGGCSLGPGSDGAGFSLPWGKGDSGARLLSPAELSAKLAGSTSVEPAADPVSLANKAKPSPDLYVTAARLSEQSGKTAEAEGLYQKALQVDSRHADALVGYARLKDRQGQMAEATRLYQRAAKAHPKNASIFNDLGLCLARQRKFSESMSALGQAIKLDPKKWLYRNNMAMVLVETGKVDAAVSHLMAVQEEAVAHYNVGYILQKKGDSEAAATHFAKALEEDPSLAEARLWLAKLGREPASIAESAPRIASERQPDVVFRAAPSDPILPQRELEAPRSAAVPIAPQRPMLGQKTPWAYQPSERRLPPVPFRPNVEEPAPGEPPARPGFSNVAPLPPPTSIGRPTQASPTSRTGLPVVSPLPPVLPQQYDSYRP